MRASCSLFITVSRYLSQSLAIYHSLSLFITVSRYLSQSLAIHHILSLFITVSRYLSQSLAIHHSLSLFITVSRYSSQSLAIYHSLSLFITVSRYSSHCNEQDARTTNIFTMWGTFPNEQINRKFSGSHYGYFYKVGDILELNIFINQLDNTGLNFTEMRYNLLFKF